MKSKPNYSLCLIAGAVALITGSIACITLLERRRARNRRALEDDVQNWEAEGGAITPTEAAREEIPLL